MRHCVRAPFVMRLHFCGIVGDAECVTLKKRQHVGMSSVMHFHTISVSSMCLCTAQTILLVSAEDKTAAKDHFKCHFSC